MKTEMNERNALGYPVWPDRRRREELCRVEWMAKVWLMTEPPAWFLDDGGTGVPEFSDVARRAYRRHDWRYWLGGEIAEFRLANVLLGQDLREGRHPVRELWGRMVALFFAKLEGWRVIRGRFHWGYDRYGKSIDELRVIWEREAGQCAA